MCQCNYCQREVKFKDILSKYEFSEEDKKFLEEYQNYCINESFDREIAEAKESSSVNLFEYFKNIKINLLKMIMKQYFLR